MDRPQHNIEDSTAKCDALLGNSMFGVVLRQACAQTTHPSRAGIRIKAIPGFSCPVFHADTEGVWLAKESAARLELGPFAHGFRDPNRHCIDNVAATMPGLDPQLDPQLDPPTDIAGMLA